MLGFSWHSRETKAEKEKGLLLRAVRGLQEECKIPSEAKKGGLLFSLVGAGLEGAGRMTSWQLIGGLLACGQEAGSSVSGLEEERRSQCWRGELSL